MLVAMRRLFWLVVLGGAAFAAWSVVEQRRRQNVPAAAPPPVSSASAAVDDIPMAFTDLADERDADDRPGVATWMAPVDGACPDGYPIKVNASSGIYHVPGGRFYDRMIPHRCYAHTADADADGYRRAKA